MQEHKGFASLLIPKNNVKAKQPDEKLGKCT